VRTAKQLVRVDVDKDLYFFAEVEASTDAPAPGAGLLNEKDKVEEIASSERVRTTVKAAVTYIRNAFAELNTPNELSLEFSIALKGKGGIPVLAEQSAEATFKISAKWINAKAEEKEGDKSIP
jgi:hypothetical protein